MTAAIKDDSKWKSLNNGMKSIPIPSNRGSKIYNRNLFKGSLSNL